MLILNNVFNKQPKQFNSIKLPDNSTFIFNLNYKSLTNGWYFDLIYKTFTLKGIKITNNINILNVFKNILPFGLSIIVLDGGEAWYLDDFASGRVEIYLLNETEVEGIETTYKTL